MTTRASPNSAAVPPRAVAKTQAGVSPIVANNVGADVPANVASNEAERCHALIAEAAYLLAEKRHFEPGHDVEDWLAAEVALDLQPLPTAIATSR